VALAYYDWVIAWDHLEGKAWLISAERAAARTSAVRERLLGPPAPSGNRLAPAPGRRSRTFRALSSSAR